MLNIRTLLNTHLVCVLFLLSACIASPSSAPVPEPTESIAAPAVAEPVAAPTAAVTSASETAPSTVENNIEDRDATASTSQTVTGTVSVNQATLYAKPDTQSGVLGTVDEGTSVDIVAENGATNWFLICCPIGPEVLSWIPEGALTLGDSTQADVLRVADLLAQPVAAASQSTITGSTTISESTAAGAASGTAEVAAPLEEEGPRDPTLPPLVSVDADLVNLRGGPGTNYPVVGQANAATELEVLGRNEDGSWWRVCCPVGEEAESWIFGTLVAPVGGTSNANLAAVPLAEIPPVPETTTVASAGEGTSNNGGAQSADNGAALAAAPAPGLPGNGGFGAPGGTNPLTGQGLPGDRPGQRPIIVCINNDFAARPQLGTSQADVMYEYLMEGFGITRFSGVFYGDDVGQIGPVRSARLINYYMGALYNAGLACSGASDGVRYTLKHEAPFPYMDIDLDDPSNARYSVSIGSDYRTRLRTSTAPLRRWLADWGVEQSASIRGFTFGGVPGGGAPATGVTVPYPGGSASAYQYDGGSGRYMRFLGGGVHVDGNSGAQVGVENVIIQFVPHEATDIVEDSLGSTSIRLNLFGGGKAILFRDGQAFEGSWRSDSRGDMPRFYNADGSEVPLKPGKTWISVVPLSYTIGYQ